MGLVLALIMGLLGGPVLALAVNAAGSKAAFEKRKEKFRNGQGKDPEQDAIGPHKSFAHNAAVFGLIFAVVGFVVGSLA